MVPSHCTGWKGELAISKALLQAFISNNVGNLLNINTSTKEDKVIVS